MKSRRVGLCPEGGNNNGSGCCFHLPGWKPLFGTPENGPAVKFQRMSTTFVGTFRLDHFSAPFEVPGGLQKELHSHSPCIVPILPSYSNKICRMSATRAEWSALVTLRPRGCPEPRVASRSASMLGCNPTATVALADQALAARRCSLPALPRQLPQIAPVKQSLTPCPPHRRAVTTRATCVPPTCFAQNLP